MSCASRRSRQRNKHPLLALLGGNLKVIKSRPMLECPYQRHRAASPVPSSRDTCLLKSANPYLGSYFVRELCQGWILPSSHPCHLSHTWFPRQVLCHPALPRPDCFWSSASSQYQGFCLCRKVAQVKRIWNSHLSLHGLWSKAGFLFYHCGKTQVTQYLLF